MIRFTACLFSDQWELVAARRVTINFHITKAGGPIDDAATKFLYSILTKNICEMLDEEPKPDPDKTLAVMVPGHPATPEEVNAMVPYLKERPVDWSKVTVEP